MKQYVSSHICGFCKHDGGGEQHTANSTNMDIELVVNDKFILMFPSMIMHYLYDTKQSHGWDNPWQPPDWFVDAIQGGGKISFSPTPLQSHTLPTYKVGYLTTINQIKREHDGMAPESYQLDSHTEKKIGPDTIIDTHGGNASFLTATRAQFGTAPSSQFLERLDGLCALAVAQHEKKTNTPLTVPDVADSDPSFPKVIVEPLKFGDYIRFYPYSAFSETKAFKDAIDLSGETKTILMRATIAPDKVSHEDFLQLFRAQCYLPMEEFQWQKAGENFAAKIDISKPRTGDIDFSKYLSFEEMTKSFLEVFSEIGIKKENIIFNSEKHTVQIPCAAFKHLEAKGVQIEDKHIVQAEVKSSPSGFFKQASHSHAPAPAPSPSPTIIKPSGHH